MNALSDDTIAAIATPPGEGGLCVIRISGPDAFQIADHVFSGSSKPTNAESHTVLYGHIVDPANGFTIDEVLMTILRAPKTYTREDVVEVSCHGGQIVSRQVLDLIISHGARFADPGEFTKRAFVNGRIDLVQAEAVAELIRARTETSARIASRQLGGRFSQNIKNMRQELISILALIEVGIDFTEEDIPEFQPDYLAEKTDQVLADLKRIINASITVRAIRDGVRVALVGLPNVGKSSLLNLILDKERAIVASSPGTTRDTIEETIDLKGLPITLIDTAGVHEASDSIENQGIQRSLQEIEQADLVLFIIDAGCSFTPQYVDLLTSVPHDRLLLVFNKIDLPVRCDISSVTGRYAYPSVQISAHTGDGLPQLLEQMFNLIITDNSYMESDVLINSRQLDHIIQSREKLSIAIENLMVSAGSEIVAIEIRDAVSHLDAVVGLEFGDDVLDLVFSQFCIGK